MRHPQAPGWGLSLKSLDATTPDGLIGASSSTRDGLLRPALDRINSLCAGYEPWQVCLCSRALWY